MSIRLYPADAKAVSDDGTFTDRFVNWLQNFMADYNGTLGDVASLLKNGSYLESVVADAAVTGWVTGVAKNITSLPLPIGGTWQVFGDAVFGGGAITGTDTLFQITTTSGAFQAINGYSQSAFEAPIVPTAASNVRASLAPRLVQSTKAVPAIAYLVGRSTFTAGGPPTAGGALRAWRVGP